MISPTMHSLDCHLASNVCCRKENSFQDSHCIGHESDIGQKLKERQYFLENSNENTSKKTTENVDSMCQTNTAGRGGGVYVLVVLSGGGWTTLQTKQGGVCVLVFGGIDASDSRRVEERKRDR